MKKERLSELGNDADSSSSSSLLFIGKSSEIRLKNGAKKSPILSGIILLARFFL